jgi:hypothetical protein
LAIQKELEIKGLAIDTHKISKILTYRLYTGERVEGVFNRQLPQIISKELFEKCRKVATAKDSKATKTKRIYYAGRLIKCSDCGSYLTARPNTNVIQYTCHHKYSKLTKRECNANDRISVNVIDSIAWYYARLKETEFIQELNEDKLKDWERQINELQTKIDNAENQYEAIKNKKRKELKRTIKSLSDKAIEQLVNDETKEEKKRIQNDVIGYKTSIGHLSEYVEQTKKNISFHESLDSFWSVFSNLKNMSDKERSDIVHKHICEIRIKNMSDTDTPTKQIDIEFFDGTIKKIFYAFRQRNKHLRVYEYDISTPCPFPYLRGDKLYKNWDEIYINRFECSQ